MNALKNINEAGEFLGLSSWTIRRWIQQGKILPVRLGSRVLIEESELERVIREGKQAGALDSTKSK